MSKRNGAALGALLVGTIAAGVLLGGLLRGIAPAYASPGIRVVITDPDSDDQVDKIIKTRSNGDGTFRTKVEAEINLVEPGKEYAIRVTVIDISAGETVEAATPNLTAQPPR